MLKKLLLTTVAVAALVSPAFADTITMTAKVDGITAALESSPNGNLDVTAQTFGTGFLFNTITATSQQFIGPTGVLTTNSVDVGTALSGSHTLTIDITAFGLLGTDSLQAFLSSFSVTKLTDGWTAREQTFINGVQLADTGVFTVTADSAFSTNLANMTNPFNAEVLYTITSNGAGRFNGGVDIDVAQAVPELGTWGMMLLGFAGVGGLAMRKRRQGAAQLRLA